MEIYLDIRGSAYRVGQLHELSLVPESEEKNKASSFRTITYSFKRYNFLRHIDLWFCERQASRAQAHQRRSQLIYVFHKMRRINPIEETL